VRAPPAKLPSPPAFHHPLSARCAPYRPRTRRGAPVRIRNSLAFGGRGGGRCATPLLLERPALHAWRAPQPPQLGHTHPPPPPPPPPHPLSPFPTPAQAHSHGRKAAVALWRCLSKKKKKRSVYAPRLSCAFPAEAFPGTLSVTGVTECSSYGRLSECLYSSRSPTY
jgi:hypothetical protein